MEADDGAAYAVLDMILNIAEDGSANCMVATYEEVGVLRL